MKMMEKLSKIWNVFVRLNKLELNNGITEFQQNNPDWINLPEDLKCILKSNNGQKNSKIGMFGKLEDGKTNYSYLYLDFESILKVHKKISDMNVSEIQNTEIPFAIIVAQDFGGYGFSINSINGQINYISFNEYDYNGGTIYNKGIYKYADNMIEFLQNQIMIKQFE